MFNKYLPTNENLQAVFGSNNPICMTGPALQAYAMEHDMNPFALCEHFRIASDEEIARWGVRGCAMSPASFEMLWIAAVESVSEHVFINDTAMNMIWGDIGCEDFVPAKRIEFLKGLWQAAPAYLYLWLSRSMISSIARLMKSVVLFPSFFACSCTLVRFSGVILTFTSTNFSMYFFCARFCASVRSAMFPPGDLDSDRIGRPIISQIDI